MTTQPQARDAMQFINEQDPATVERFVARLELRGKDPTFVAYRESYLDAMDLPRTAAVLEIGCGTGVVSRAIASRDGFAGTVTGVDQSEDFIEVARTLAANDAAGDRVQFAVGDAYNLDFPAASFDAAIAHTLVSHVGDPLAVLEEAARVVRPGGLRGRLRRRLRVADLRLLGPAPRRGHGGRAPGDDHELATRHARSPAPAAEGRPAADRNAGERLRRGRIEHVHAQPGRDLRRRWRPRPDSCPPRRSTRGSQTNGAPPPTAPSSPPATTTPTWHDADTAREERLGLSSGRRAFDARQPLGDEGAQEIRLLVGQRVARVVDHRERGVRVVVDEVGRGRVPDRRVQPPRHDQRRTGVRRPGRGSAHRSPTAHRRLVDERGGRGDEPFVPVEHLRGLDHEVAPEVLVADLARPGDDPVLGDVAHARQQRADQRQTRDLLRAPRGHRLREVGARRVTDQEVRASRRRSRRRSRAACRGRRRRCALDAGAAVRPIPGRSRIDPPQPATPSKAGSKQASASRWSTPAPWSTSTGRPAPCST